MYFIFVVFVLFGGILVLVDEVYVDGVWFMFVYFVEVVDCCFGGV